MTTLHSRAAAKASDAGHPYCVPFSDEQKKSMARCPTCGELYVFDTIIETTSGDPLPHPMDMGPMVKDPDLMVHHTPAAAERWEVQCMRTCYHLTDDVPAGWEPFAVTEKPGANGEPRLWLRRRLPAGVARG